MKPFAILLITALLLVTLGSAPASAEGICGDTYTVQPGDSLFSISEKCKIKYIVLLDINYEITDPNMIRPGQVIRMTAEEPLLYLHGPVSGPAQEGGLQSDGSYLVRPGDSLARIAYLYHTTLWDLYQVNPQLGGRPLVYPGESIHLPSNARHQKGWVGVSGQHIARYSDIEVRVVDFPPYANIEYCLYQLPVSHEDLCIDDPYHVIMDGRTDARGSARTVMTLPYWAYNGETWLVDVHTLGVEGDDATQAFSPQMTVGQ